MLQTVKVLIFRCLFYGEKVTELLPFVGSAVRATRTEPPCPMPLISSLRASVAHSSGLHTTWSSSQRCMQQIAGHRMYEALWQ